MNFPKRVYVKWEPDSDSDGGGFLVAAENLADLADKNEEVKFGCYVLESQAKVLLKVEVE